MDGADGTRRRLIALTLAPGLGAVRIGRLLEHFGSVDGAWLAPEEALVGVPGIGRGIAAAVTAARGASGVRRAETILHRAARCGARVVTWLDADYPVRLRGIPASPPAVYIRGELGRDERPAVAIVGTRRATPYGLGVAERLAAALAARGVVGVSGLALGIDGAAHRGAVKSGGPTVGVLGCGVDVAYPPEHGSLMEAMIRNGGALIAEAPMGTPADRGLFPARNRLISGLADAVVVVEAGIGSGAMITASCAVAQGRPVFAVPGSVYAAESRGPHRLLAAGANVLSSPDDVLAVLDGVSNPQRLPRQAAEAHEAVRPPKHQGISSAERRVLAALDPGDARSIDTVAAATGMDVAAVAATLVALEVRGATRRVAGGLYVRDGVPAAEQPAAPRGRNGTGGTVWHDHWS